MSQLSKKNVNLPPIVILAAGFGKRLNEITENKTHKSLIEIPYYHSLNYDYKNKRSNNNVEIYIKLMQKYKLNAFLNTIQKGAKKGGLTQLPKEPETPETQETPPAFPSFTSQLEMLKEPLLQIIIRKYAYNGFRNFIIIVGNKKDQIISFLTKRFKEDDLFRAGHFNLNLNLNILGNENDSTGRKDSPYINSETHKEVYNGNINSINIEDWINIFVINAREDYIKGPLFTLLTLYSYLNDKKDNPIKKAFGNFCNTTDLHNFGFIVAPADTLLSEITLTSLIEYFKNKSLSSSNMLSNSENKTHLFIIKVKERLVKALENEFLTQFNTPYSDIKITSLNSNFSGKITKNKDSVMKNYIDYEPDLDKEQEAPKIPILLPLIYTNLDFLQFANKLINNTFDDQLFKDHNHEPQKRNITKIIEALRIYHRENLEYTDITPLYMQNLKMETLYLKEAFKSLHQYYQNGHNKLLHSNNYNSTPTHFLTHKDQEGLNIRPDLYNFLEKLLHDLDLNLPPFLDIDNKLIYESLTKYTQNPEIPSINNNFLNENNTLANSFKIILQKILFIKSFLIS